MSTLVVNKSESYHKECGPGTSKMVRPSSLSCPKCGATFTVVTSDYAGGGIEGWIRRHRPDLEHDFPFENYWEKREGEELLAELTMDTQQGNIEDSEAL